MPALCDLYPSPAIYTVFTTEVPKVIDAAQTVQIRSNGSFPIPSTDLDVFSASHTNVTDFQIGYCDLGDFDPPTITILDTATAINRTIVVGDGRLIFIKCLTAAPGTYTTTLTFFTNDPVGPKSVEISYTVVASNIQIEVTPLVHDYGQVLVGDTTSEFLFRVRSIGANPATVQAPTIPSDFVAGGTVPAYPITIPFLAGLDFIGGGAIDFIGGGAIDLISGIDYFDFGISAKPLANFLINELMEVNSNASNDPVEVQLVVYGLAITPYGPLDSTVESLLVSTFGSSLATPLGAPTVLEADPDNLDSERDCFLYKQMNFNLPGVPKSTYAFDMHYEDLGVAEVGLTLSTEDLSQTGLDFGTVGADGLTKLVSSLPVEVQGEIISMILEKDADMGPLSLTDFIFRHLPFDVRRGEVPIPTNITPYAQLSSPDARSLLAFIANCDDAVLAVDNARLQACGLSPYVCNVCPLPRKIGALLPGDPSMWSANCRPGPFALVQSPNVNCPWGVRFAGVFRNVADPKKLDLWISDDMGFTWAVANTLGFPALATSIVSHDVFQSGTVLHVVTKEATSGKVRYHQVDLTTKTWSLYNESVNGSGADADSPGSTYPNQVAICVRSGGDVVISYVSDQETVSGTPRSRFLVRSRTAGVWSSAVTMGRVGQAKDSILQRGIPEPANVVRMLFQMAPGGVASAIDDDVQFLLADNTVSAITTWQTHGISGHSVYGRPFSYSDLSKFILPLWDSGEADLHFFTAGSPTEDSVTDLGMLTQFGASGSGNASMIAGRIGSTNHSMALDWSLGGGDLWAKYDLVAGVGTKVSPHWTSGNNLQELSGQILSIYGGTWLFYFLGNANGDGTFFFLLNVASLGTIATTSIAAWEASLPSQDATIPYSAVGCQFLLKADPFDFRTEKLPFWEKTFEFPLGANMLEGKGEQRGYEAFLARFWVEYESLGASEWKCTATTRRGMTYTESVATSTSSSEATNIAIFDIRASDAIIKVRFEVTCGRASLVEAYGQIEPSGELTKGT
jgi:hypothetical protein